MGKKNNSYKASYKLKVICFTEQSGNRAAQSEFWILESNVRYWRKQEELLKLSKVWHFVVQKLENLYILHTMIFRRPNYKKKFAYYASKYGIVMWCTVLYIEARKPLCMLAFLLFDAHLVSIFGLSICSGTAVVSTQLWEFAQCVSYSMKDVTCLDRYWPRHLAKV
jgi:hypothetical protein